MIQLENVTKTYPKASRPSLDNVSVGIEKGEFVFFIGPSGSGKSTIIKLLLHEVTPTQGKVVVNSKDVTSMRSWKIPHFRRSIGCVFQDFRLLPNRTAYENVAFALEVIGKTKAVARRVVPEVLELVGLGGKEHRYPHELSGGEQQRVAIARALVNRPQVLLADEPTGNLDPATSVDIMQLLARINAGGTTVVMATHEAGFVDQMQRRVIELVDGEMVRDERHGGYGDTSGIPSLAPEPERGAAAVAALTAVLEVQRETALSPSAAVSSAYGHGGTADIAARAAATAAAAAVHAVTQAADTSTDEETADAASPEVEAVEQSAAVAEEAPAAKAPKPADTPAPRTQPVPLVDIAEVDVAELGLADRLGLGETDPDDEVGPTS